MSVTIKANNVDVSASGNGYGIILAEGSSHTVSGNVVISSYVGVTTQTNAAGSVSANTTKAVYGIVTSGGASVTSNLVNNATGAGIVLLGGLTAGVINLNKITNANIGIDFNCVTNPNVTENTITAAQTGITHVQAGLAAPNTYFDVATIRTGGC